MKKNILMILVVVIGLNSCINQNKKENYGSINGKLCYPSDGVPGLTIFIKNIKTNKIIKTTTKSCFDNCSYRVNNIPIGEYIVYACTTQPIYDNVHLFGGYFKECFSSSMDKPHKPSIFSVKSNITTENIDICDFYGNLIIPKVIF